MAFIAYVHVIELQLHPMLQFFCHGKLLKISGEMWNLLCRVQLRSVLVDGIGGPIDRLRGRISGRHRLAHYCAPYDGLT